MQISSIRTNLVRGYHGFSCLAESAQSTILLLIRLVWGLQFAQAGWGKWQDLTRVAGFFAELGIPFPEVNALIVATVELIGGMCLALGLASRLTSVPLLVAMGVAYLTTEQEALAELWGNPDPFLTAAPFLFMFASLLILIFGPGKYSLDAWIHRHLRTFL